MEIVTVSRIVWRLSPFAFALVSCDHKNLDRPASGAGGSGAATVGVGGIGATGSGGTAGAMCGNGFKDNGEACDKGDLGGATCASAVAPGWIGSAACTADCKLDLGGCKTPDTKYNDLANASNWTVFDTTTVNPGAKGFIGAPFDGRFLYFVPNNNNGQMGPNDGIIARFDTQAPFSSTPSWMTFDVSTVNAGAKGFATGAFDGRHVYLVPVSGIVVARVDTQAPFAAASSWATFDVSTVNALAKEFHSAAFDGRYVYLIPRGGGVSGGIVIRFDIEAPFGMASSWAAFDVSTVNAGAKGFAGATFDGRYVFLAPYANDGGSDGVVARFDTQAPFGMASSWATFDVATVNAGAKGFAGATFDGRYLYLVPYDNGARDGIVTRYDTQAPFGMAMSWATFDVSTVKGGAKGFVGATFDGRFVYFAPNNTCGSACYDGVVARYDTQAAFGAGSSWATFDVAGVNAGATGFAGAAFDGRFVYFVPYRGGSSGIVAKFDAKSPSWLPKGWNGSFF